MAQVVAAYNTNPHRGLNGQSPALVWERNVRSRATREFEDIAHVRHVLGRAETALLTFDGVEKNGIRYRDASAVSGLLDNMAHTQQVRGRRKDGTITIGVKIRISPGDLDAIRVWDTVVEEWVTLPSTQPTYTHKLSEWEHREFTRMAARRNESFTSEEDRLASKAETMRMIDELAPRLPFQQRRNMAALYVNQQVKRLAGSVADQPAPIPLDFIAPAAPQVTMESSRRDDGLPQGAGARGTGGASRPVAPEREDERTGTEGQNSDGEGTDIEWDDVEVMPPEDREAGHEPPPFEERWTEDEA